MAQSIKGRRLYPDSASNGSGDNFQENDKKSVNESSSPYQNIQSYQKDFKTDTQSFQKKTYNQPNTQTLITSYPKFESKLWIEPHQHSSSSQSVCPPSFSNVIYKDDGQATGRFLRVSSEALHHDPAKQNKSLIPIGAIVQPLAEVTQDEENPPMIDYGEAGPLRCNRCRGYANPSWQFNNQGKSGVCNLCLFENPIPEYYFGTAGYFSSLSKDIKPELFSGVCDFLAPSSLIFKHDIQNNILLLIEIDYNNYFNGTFHQILNTLKYALDYFPSPDTTNIGILTYETSTNVFRFSKNKMSITTIRDDEFGNYFPSKGVCLNILSQRSQIDSLIDQMIQYYQNYFTVNNRSKGTCYGSALNIAANILGNGGRILAFTRNMTTQGPFTLSNRDNLKAYGTTNEPLLYSPQTNAYRMIAEACLNKGVSVDLFCFADSYYDLCTVGDVSALTGGNVYYYPTFDSSTDQERLYYDIFRNFTRPVGYDVNMTVRTSQGLEFGEYIHLGENRTDPSKKLSVLDGDFTFSFSLKYTEKLKTTDILHFQIAVLFTNMFGQRVIRVINKKLKLTANISEMYTSCDVETISQLLLKTYARKIPLFPIKTPKTELNDTLINLLHVWQSNAGGVTQLDVSRDFNLLQTYIYAGLRSPLFSLGSVNADDRINYIYKILSNPPAVISNLLYPKIFPIHNLIDDTFSDGNDLPDSMRNELSLVKDDGVYLIDNTEFIYLYIRKEVRPEFLESLIGTSNFEEIANFITYSEENPSNIGEKLRYMIATLRKIKNSNFQSIKIVYQDGPLEPYIKTLFLETASKADSFANFVDNVKKSIQIEAMKGNLKIQ